MGLRPPTCSGRPKAYRSRWHRRPRLASCPPGRLPARGARTCSKAMERAVGGRPRPACSQAHPLLAIRVVRREAGYDLPIEGSLVAGRVGEVLASKYRLEELLGSGGMGEVYRAVNELVGRRVAIKILKTEHARNDEIVQRFLREAKTANLIRHPNVVDVLDIGTDEKGTPFIVQELLTGVDLSKHVSAQGGRLSLEETVDLLAPIIDAVAEA